MEPASYALFGTRIFTLVIAVVMGALSLEGEQRLAKLGLSGVTVGTLLLTPDISNAVLALRLSEQTRKRLTDQYLKFLDAFAGAALFAIIGGVVEQVVRGVPRTVVLVAYVVSLLLLGAVIAGGGGLPIWHRGNAAEGPPEGEREGNKRLSVRARIRLARLETHAVPAGIGVVLFLVGTALQFRRSRHRPRHGASVTTSRWRQQRGPTNR